jgi:glycerol-3-phosphate dehydrogenase
MSWSRGTREAWWAEPAQDWDIIVIGGGIMGAGILREAARCGLRVLLLEQNDFASGTSSRSSKLVHGGLRYLKTGQWHLTLESVRERERLLREGAGLVEPLGFILPVYERQRPPGWMLRIGLFAYDLMARRLQHRLLGVTELLMLAPRIREHALAGGFVYPDAQTDDARLTLRVIQEALAEGPQVLALNYARVGSLLREEGQACGVRVHDHAGGARHKDLRAKLVINASGAWADKVRAQIGAQARLRPLRGSHLVFPYHRLPVAQAVSLFHPGDRRPVFIFPWEGVIIVGTTDIDHGADLDRDPVMSLDEARYLMQAVHHQFPGLDIKLEHAVASYCGVRPVIAGGNADPSRESRDFALWEEEGLLTITGGKLTTFRATALQALRRAGTRLPALSRLSDAHPILNPLPTRTGPQTKLTTEVIRRLYGRYGAHAPVLLAQASAEDLKAVGDSPYLWAELTWAAAHESVLHLQDLLLRRTRIGFVMREGGLDQLPEIRRRCQPLLGWDDARWGLEENSYRDLWQRAYRVPKPGEGE